MAVGGGAGLPGAGGALSMWEACLLGLVQGLTEFLPISSDGHLALAQHLLTAMPAGDRLAVTVALHLGTLVAVVAYFWRDLWHIAAGLFPPRRRDSTWRQVWLLVIATAPAAAAGVALKGFIGRTLDSPLVIGGCFLLTGTLLYLASAVRGALRTEDSLRTRDALVIGLFQAFALLPGVSRSGTTIAAGLFRQARAEVAARFSFLLAVPAIAGAIAVETPHILRLGADARAALVFGIVVAAITGAVAIAALLRLVRSGRLHWFAYYCWAVGLAVLGATAAGGL